MLNVVMLNVVILSVVAPTSLVNTSLPQDYPKRFYEIPSHIFVA